MRWDGRRVLVTGHAGFKGGWLALYADALGAEVHGYGRARTAGPSFYEAARVRGRLASEARDDVLDVVRLREAMRAARPEVVVHLAARAIVRESVRDPLGTVRTNVVGTAAVLEAVRHTPSVQATVVATSDKVYANDGRTEGYAEDDRLGGASPYGASKAAAEMIAGGYRATYGLNVVTARSGNAVGGGDWGAGRLVPACLAALAEGRAPVVHDATRPFLHVLDVVRGYLTLAAAAWEGRTRHAAFNFGPKRTYPLVDVAERLAARTGGTFRAAGPPEGEARRLAVSAARARRVLGWSPRWTLAEALDRTADWHDAWRAGADMALVSAEQIAAHRDAGREAVA